MFDFRDVGDDPQFPIEIERLGYDGFWRPHSIIRDFSKLDTLQILTVAATRTSRIMLGTAVLQVPLYHPVDLAKRVMTLDHLSGGRFLFGVGTGWVPREFENLGVPFRQRAGRTDEGLELMRRLWTEEEVTFEGKYYQVREARFQPKPVTKPYPRVLVGGIWGVSQQGAPGEKPHANWSEWAINRTARWGDGWVAPSSMPVAHAAEILSAGVEQVKARARDFGRTITDDDFILVAESGFINIQATKEAALAESQRHYESRQRRGFYQIRGNPSLETHLQTGVYGTPDMVAAYVQAWLDVKRAVPSLKRIQLNFATHDPVDQLHRFHEQVRPLLHLPA